MVIHPERFPQLRSRLWRVAWFVVAFAYALPIGWVAYNRIIDVTRKAREELIVHYRLWELQPEYHGTPQTWTRFASRLLTDRQLLRRVRAKYGPLAEQIELDYRRDLTIAQGLVVLTAVGLWAIPLAVLYGIGVGIVYLGSRPKKSKKTPPPSVFDPRYRD